MRIGAYGLCMLYSFVTAFAVYGSTGLYGLSIAAQLSLCIATIIADEALRKKP